MIGGTGWRGAVEEKEQGAGGWRRRGGGRGRPEEWTDKRRDKLVMIM